VIFPRAISLMRGALSVGQLGGFLLWHVRKSADLLFARIFGVVLSSELFRMGFQPAFRARGLEINVGVHALAIGIEAHKRSRDV
jgi:hypothetical protein